MLTVKPDQTNLFLPDFGAIAVHKHLVFIYFQCYQPSRHFAAQNFML